MYTVLIQSKETKDTLQQFDPLLKKSIDADKIGVCQWIESGVTAATALPDLYDLISRKREWRAVIVSSEFDDANTRYPSDPYNPFDFEENKDREGLTVVDGKLVDCEAPLIRLTHMLGGIPAPEPEFEAVIIEQEGRVPYTEYHPVNNAETEARKEALERWNEEHLLEGLPPAEIILIKVRKDSVKTDALSSVKAAWQMHTESDSSEFWKRNLYPHNCRFLVFDLERRGIMRKQSDLFRFWTAVLLISLNEIDPNVLQAHRLYKLDIRLDEKELEECFQTTVDSLNLAKSQLEKGIAKEEKSIPDDAPIPDYHVGVPVSFQLPTISGIFFHAEEYGLTGGEGSGDLAAWENYSKGALKEFQALSRSVDRTLDQASRMLRDRCEYAEEEVVPLSPYQEEDLNDSLSQDYAEMLRQQELLPGEISDIEEDVGAAEGKVREAVNRRVTAGQAAAAFGTAIGVCAVSLLPGLLSDEEIVPVSAAILIASGILAVAGITVLAAQRKAMIRLMEHYQMVFQNALGQLTRNSYAFSDFLSSVASLIHGQSYLNIMKQKLHKRSSTYYFRKKNLKAIDIFLSKLSLWSAALHVKVDMDSAAGIQLADEISGEIDYDDLYSLKGGKGYPVPLNRAGINIESPYRFVEQIEIEREEVYDYV